MLNDFINDYRWEIIHELFIEPRLGKIEGWDDLKLTKYTSNYLASAVPGMYIHQKEAIRSAINGENVCLVTGTASGKSLAFYASGIEILANNPKAKIIAIYPLKALGREQEKRWLEILEQAGYNVKVGRIDGDVKGGPQRKKILQSCGIVIMTPDIMHAWLLANINDKVIANFLLNVALFVIDEVHTYSGVFGSNAAYLFRRIRHLMAIGDSNPHFICASATMANPEKHLLDLIGVHFRIIDSDMDTSPKHETKIVLLKPPGLSDHLTDVTRFLKELAKGNDHFIAFVDSRKQTELITSILSRGQSYPGQDDEAQEDNEIDIDTNYLKTLNILPYRAGYEEEDQLIIQERLSQGTLKGVVSTSALELGLDIKYLNVAVLLGVPYSSTSLKQRIGRIGRHSPGIVYVIHSGGVYDDLVFSNPTSLFNRPLAEGALYLQNPRIQYIHALCLSRENGEHDRFCNTLNLNVNEDDFNSMIDWPKGFLALCKSERIGEITPDLQVMKSEVNNDNPNIIYPLRDVESQFKVMFKQGPVREDKGSLSYSQLLREAYPGAVYYYATEAFRTYKIITRSRTVYVRKEKKYTTLPIQLQSVYPNLNSDNIYEARRHGDLLVMESNVQVRESVLGYKEKRGSKEAVSYQYPLSGLGNNIFFDMPRFTRIYFTSGVIFTYSGFNKFERIVSQAAARLIYEAFLMSIPFERQDIDIAFEKHRATREPYVKEGDHFIAIYDRTYGSLRLSGHVMAEDSMGKVFKQALDIASISDEVAGVNESLPVTPDVVKLLEDLYAASITPGKKVAFDLSVAAINEKECEKIILPGSIGLALKNDNAEYRIESVFFNPRVNDLCYRGKYVNQPKMDDSDIIWSVKDIAESSGESVLGYYNYETGELTPANNAVSK